MKILLSVKNENAGLELADFAVKHFFGNEHQFCILHVIPPITAYVSLAAVPELIDDCVRRDRALGVKIVDAVATSLKTNGVRANEIEELIAEGNPVEEIVSLSRTAGTDLILLYHSQSSGLQNWLCGNVSTAVVARADCTVLLVNPIRKSSGDAKPELLIPKHATSMLLG